jgi:hypothetical protein
MLNSFPILLTLLFVAGKITGYLSDWSWWLVFFPVIIQGVVVTLLFGFAVFMLWYNNK